MIRSCPVCGSERSEEIHRLNLTLFDDHPLPDSCVTGVCIDCGMAFNRETASADHYKRYYQTLSKYVESTASSAVKPRLPECSIQLAKLLPKESYILDVGCGSGGVLASLKQNGFTRLAGIDPTEACIRQVRDTLGIDARVGTLDNPPFPPEGFDVAISTVVFEHLLNPGDDIDKIGSLLKPDGLVYILVPDVTRYAEFLLAPYQDVNVEHINHFSKQSLDNLFTVRGWSVVASGVAPFVCSPTWSATLAWGLYRKPTGKMAQSHLEFDSKSRQALQEYFSASGRLLERISDNLSRSLIGQDEIIIWGGGHTTSMLLTTGALQSKKILGIVDSNVNYQGRVIRNIPVGSFSLIPSSEIPIVVATIREQDAVIDRIRTLGLNNPLITLDVSVSDENSSGGNGGE